ncbi:MAG: hypothetical protein HOQ12_01775 [Gemmatimonadaceae bacterium]|nr:hypothetical protein [Gemmatimonadaceae bacterium]
MAALPVVLAGVGSHETAYRLDAGDTIVVGLSQRPLRAGDAAVTLVVSVDIADPDRGSGSSDCPIISPLSASRRWVRPMGSASPR